MQLHRATKVPDWEYAPPGQRNSWQRLAARTSGVVTPANILSLLGLSLVGVGLVLVGHHELWTGFIVLGVGRLLDIADGIVADRTGTKSHIGEGIDAGCDKIAALATLIVFTIIGILPWPVALLVGVQNGSTAVLSLIADSLRRTVHPTAVGKIGGLVEWIALLGFALGAATDIDALVAAAYVVGAASLVLNFWATRSYVQMAFGRQRP